MCPALSTHQMQGPEYLGNAQKPPGTAVKRRRGSLCPFCKWGAKKGLSALPQFIAQESREAEGGLNSTLLLSGESLPGPDGGGVGGHLVTRFGPKHPTFPRKLMDVGTSRKGKQKDRGPFWCGAKWKIYVNINKHSSPSLGSAS